MKKKIYRRLNEKVLSIFIRIMVKKKQKLRGKKNRNQVEGVDQGFKQDK